MEVRRKKYFFLLSPLSKSLLNSTCIFFLVVWSLDIPKNNIWQMTIFFWFPLFYLANKEIHLQDCYILLETHWHYTYLKNNLLAQNCQFCYYLAAKPNISSRFFLSFVLYVYILCDVLESLLNPQQRIRDL